MGGTESNKLTITSAAGYGVCLTNDQAACVEFHSDKTQLIVKGAAGAGKSLVLMARATKLMKDCKPGMRNKILVPTYTQSLTKYAKEFLDPQEQNKEYVKIVTIDSYISEICKKMTKFRDYPHGGMISHNESERIIGDLLKSRSSKPHRFYRIRNDKDLEKNVNFWKEEFNWMMGLGLTPDDEDMYLDTERKGRGNSKRMSTNDRVEAFSLFSEYIGKLHSMRKIDREEYKLFLDRNRMFIPEEFKFDHVLVDEAQDLPITAMHIAIALSKKTVLVAMDANQRLYAHHWRLKDLGISTTSKYLKQSFRCTKQIDAFAEALRSKNEKYLDSDDVFSHAVPDVEGPLPQVLECPDQDAEFRVLSHVIGMLLEDERAVTAIILRTKGEIMEWAEKLSAMGIPHEIIVGGYNRWRDQSGESDATYTRWTYNTRSPGLKLCTIHSAKGLEFHNVIIPHFNSRRYPPASRQSEDMVSKEDQTVKYRNLCYVAMTRARVNLVISYFGNASVYLDEIEEATDDAPDDSTPLLFDYHIVDSNGELDDSGQIEVSIESDACRYSVIRPPSATPSLTYGDGGAVSESKDYVESRDMQLFELYLTRAEGGNVESMYEVAQCYEIGRGVMQNRIAAIEWYQKGANNDNSDCMLKLGAALIEGMYIDKDVQGGIRWLAIAARRGNLEARRMLGDLFLDGTTVGRDTDYAISQYLSASRDGDVESMRKLALIFRDGTADSIADRESYLHWLCEAAENGDPDSQYEYGTHLMDVEKFADAARFFQQAADSGNAEAQLQLHRCYLDAIGVQKDDKLSKIWLKKAVKQECPEAEFRMYEVLKDGLLGDVDPAGANRYLRRAAEHHFDKAREVLKSYDAAKNDSADAPTQTISPGDIDDLDTLVSDAASRGFEVIDRRSVNGAVWIVDGPGVEGYISQIKDRFGFSYSERGSRSTRHRPAWYL